MLKAVFPDRAKTNDNKKSNVETFTQKQAKKGHPSFVSASNRTDFSAINTSIPGAYDVSLAYEALKDRKDF
jgi:hypothetical protein